MCKISLEKQRCHDPSPSTTHHVPKSKKHKHQPDQMRSTQTTLYMQKGSQLVRHFLSVCVCVCVERAHVRVGNFHLFTNHAEKHTHPIPKQTLTPFTCQLHLAGLSGGFCVRVCLYVCVCMLARAHESGDDECTPATPPAAYPTWFLYTSLVCVCVCG